MSGAAPTFTGGTTGSGGQLIIDTPTDDGGVDGGSCGGESLAGEVVPLDIYIMFDQSKSMSCPIATGDRWGAVKAALTSFVQNQGASSINVGLGYFGTDQSPPGSSCAPADYQPEVGIGPLSQNAQAIVDSLNGHFPLTDTPTLPAVQAAITHASTWKDQHPGHTVVVVLVTDGEPNTCGANTVDQVVSVAGTGFSTGGIPTYVIGILSPGSTCSYDPNAPDQAHLDAVAQAGGTGAALIVDTTVTGQDPGAQFLATMNEIRQTAQLPCEYGVPVDDTTGLPPSPKLVNVDYLDPAAQKTELFFVDTPDQCDPVAGGWHFDVPQGGAAPEQPSKIILCPSTCSVITGIGFVVNINLGCPTRDFFQ
jgi:hypothetical protein